MLELRKRNLTLSELPILHKNAPLNELYFMVIASYLQANLLLTFIQNLKGTNQTFELSCSGDILARHKAKYQK